MGRLPAPRRLLGDTLCRSRLEIAIANWRGQQCVQTTAHINFRGDARKSLEFYRSVFGGDISIAPYADIHAVEDPSDTDEVAFGRVAAASGFDIMAYDVQPSKPFNGGENAFYVTLQGTDAEEIKTLWTALSDGATAVHTPLAPAAFAPLYCVLTDRFGVTSIVGAMTAS